MITCSFITPGYSILNKAWIRDSSLGLFLGIICIGKTNSRLRDIQDNPLKDSCCTPVFSWKCNTTTFIKYASTISFCVSNEVPLNREYWMVASHHQTKIVCSSNNYTYIHWEYWKTSFYFFSWCYVFHRNTFIIDHWKNNSEDQIRGTPPTTMPQLFMIFMISHRQCQLVGWTLRPVPLKVDHYKYKYMS